MRHINAKTISLLSFILLVALISAGIGMISGQRNWAPMRVSNEMFDAAKSFYRTGRVLPDTGYFRRRGYAPDQRYLVNRPDDVMEGFIAVTRLDAAAVLYVVDLLDVNGDVLHSWSIDYSKLVENGEPLQYTHATKVMPDGSLLVSFDAGHAMARLDQCGGTMWARTDQTYHHTFQADPDGVWTWRALLSDSSDDQKLYRFDPETGEGLETIDVIDDIVNASPRNALITAIPEGYIFHRDTPSPSGIDLFHPNDIEPLSASMADAFPQFSVGDLLISLRNLNLVGVLDRETHEFLWASRGPWYEQHDPDWQPDGTMAWTASERIVADPAQTTRGVLEPTIAFLADGRLMMVMRGSNAKRHEHQIIKRDVANTKGAGLTRKQAFGPDDRKQRIG